MALDYAEGEYLFFIDPDDIVMVNFFDEVIPYLKKDKLDILGFKYTFEKKYGVFSPKGTKKYKLISQKQYIIKICLKVFGFQRDEITKT